MSLHDAIDAIRACPISDEEQEAAIARCVRLDARVVSVMMAAPTALRVGIIRRLIDQHCHQPTTIAYAVPTRAGPHTHKTTTTSTYPIQMKHIHNKLSISHTLSPFCVRSCVCLCVSLFVLVDGRYEVPATHPFAEYWSALKVAGSQPHEIHLPPAADAVAPNVVAPGHRITLPADVFIFGQEGNGGSYYKRSCYTRIIELIRTWFATAGADGGREVIVSGNPGCGKVS